MDAYAKDGVECLKGGAGMISDLVEVDLEKFATKNNELTQNHAGWKQLTLGGQIAGGGPLPCCVIPLPFPRSGSLIR